MNLNPKDYAVGDDTWIYIGDHQGERTKGTVVAILDLDGWSMRHYVIEVPTHIDPLLEVRNAFQMYPS
jgi:hypothetical protein